MQRPEVSPIRIQTTEGDRFVTTHGLVLPFVRKHRERGAHTIEKIVGAHIRGIIDPEFEGMITIDAGTPHMRNHFSGLVLHALGNAVGGTDLHIGLTDRTPQRL